MKTSVRRGPSARENVALKFYAVYISRNVETMVSVMLLFVGS